MIYSLENGKHIIFFNHCVCLISTVYQTNTMVKLSNTFLAESLYLSKINYFLLIFIFYSIHKSKSYNFSTRPLSPYLRSSDMAQATFGTTHSDSCEIKQTAITKCSVINCVVGVISLVVGCVSVSFSLWGMVDDDWVTHVTRYRRWGGWRCETSSGHSERWIDGVKTYEAESARVREVANCPN